MKFFKEIYRAVLRFLPDKFAMYVIYFRGYHRILNLKNPRYFGEKIQWLKLYGHLEELSGFADKYEVRKFVKEVAGEEYLNELYGVYRHPDEIPYDELPEQFVLKCTNGSGAILICQNKAQFDRKRAKKTMTRWLNDNFYLMKKELQYKNIENRIIAEKYLEDDSGTLRDYKFYCYDGIPAYYAVFADRYTNKTLDMYDMSGNKLSGVTNAGIKNSSQVMAQGPVFPEMVELVHRLAAPFQFVRVDLYCVKDRIYFGELTFTDGAGAEPFSPRSFDLEMAKRIKLGNVWNKEKAEKSKV